MGPMSDQHVDSETWIARVMFVLSLVFLVIIAALIVLWVDMPRAQMMAAGAADSEAELERIVESHDSVLARVLITTLMVIWPCFWIELLYKVRTYDQGASFWPRRRFDLIACFCPPLRLAAPNCNLDGKIWLPFMGWQQPGKALFRSLERIFGTPMLCIALIILPVLVVEFGLRGLVEEHFWLQLTLHICTGFIWCAFSIEFIVMISATDKKLAYVKKNWIDLAIILLPLISFLRSLRAVRAFKVAKFAKVQQLARVGRIYRMRGLMAKALRALMLFEFLNRLLRVTPEKKLERLVNMREERLEELEDLEEEIRAIQAKVEESQARREQDQKALETETTAPDSSQQNKEPPNQGSNEVDSHSSDDQPTDDVEDAQQDGDDGDSGSKVA